MAAEEDAVKVCVRVRPIIQREQGDQVNFVWKAENSTISQIDGTRSFHFDRVFNSLETTTQVYQEVAVPIIRSALHGYNGTIFAYGQTSSGKTYTMMGSPDNLGIIPQAVKEVFRIIQEIPNREFLLRVSYMEIYNETVTDLLCDSRKKKPLEVREDINRNVYVADLTEELVMSPEHVLQWIKKGEKNRHYGETKMNEHSSRSHTIFRMIVESRERNDPGNSENCEGAVMVSHLNLVDLAGSERASQTGAEGVRLKEGCNINRSLFILGQVIKKLSDDQPGVFINYRDSKLTRILQNSLGGNTKTVIICTITPVSFDETLSTLQFASAAKKVKNKPHVNEVLDDEALLKRYRKEIMDLKKQLEDLEESSVSKAHAMAKEEHAQLLAVIQQLQKEKEERVSNLKNIVIDAAVSLEELQPKRKRRVTWAAEKIKSTLYGSGVSPFDAAAASKIGARFPKRAKTSDLQTLHEYDDSICTEFSDIDESTRVFEDFYPEWDLGSKVTLRDRPAFHQSMIDFNSDTQTNSTLLKDSSSPKNNTLEQKIADLEDQLKTMAKDYAAEVEKRQSIEKESLKLREQLEAKEEEKVMLLKAHELEITSLKDQIERPEDNEMRLGLEATDQLEVLDFNNTQSQDKRNQSDQCTQTEQEEDHREMPLSSPSHDLCQEQIQMLEMKIADMEASNQQSDFVESLQICEALMSEKESALNELATMRENFDSVVVENESLKQELAVLETYLQEKNETNEFEKLEKETQKEHEAQLSHEICNLRKVVENAELYNQELETELENKSKILKEQEKLIAELKKDAEVLMKKARYSDLSMSMGGDGEKLCEEVFQLKQSLGDAETVTRDSQREAAFLRSENLELKEKMVELSNRCDQREKDAASLEKQLETEKSNYKRMQADLQKELQCAFNEINQLNGLMAGRVPKDLLSRVELEKKIADCSKQLTNALEEKNTLEKEVAYLSELKPLPSEIEQLKNQIQKMSEELHLLQNEKDQADILISDQNGNIQEQKEDIERLTEEVTNAQSKFQQTEQQYSELKVTYEDLQTRCSLTDEELKKKILEAECLVKEINDLKVSLENSEGELLIVQQEKEELAQAQQERASQTSSMEEMLMSAQSERDDLQKQVSNLSSLVETLQQQEHTSSELLKEKQDLDQKHLQLMSEMEQLQDQLGNLQKSLSSIQAENSECKLKIQELQEEMTLLAQQRDELQSKVEELTAENTVLKQDLNDNIEMSIETQDELRTTQEELKHQKQLVADLRKQILDNAEHISLQAERHESTPEACEDSETISEKKMELEVENQSLISEMEPLKERLKSAELALANLEGEKNELLQKLHALEEDFQSVTKQKDQLESAKGKLLEEKNDLQDEVERTTKQAFELSKELKHLSEKYSHEDKAVELLEQIEEKQKLLETLKAVTDERDQLKLDLHDNIEMSIETQEELRNALDELKEKSKLLDALKAQMDDSNGQTCNMEINQKDKDKDTLDKEVQVLTEEFGNDEINASDRLEAENEQTLLKERIDQLQQQIHVITQEKEQNEQLIDALKAENLHLVSVQRHTEDEEEQNTNAEDLTSVIEKLKEQLENTSQQLALKDQEAKQAAMRLMELNNTEQHMAKLEMLEKNLQQSSMLLEEIQGEKLELSNKLAALQEELEMVTCYKDDLQGKLEIAQGENASLKEILETASSTTQEEMQRCHELQQQESQVPVSVQDQATSPDLTLSLEEQAHSLQEQLLQKTNEYEQLLQMKNKLEEDQNSLNCELENLSNRMTEAQINLETLENEKHQTQEQLLDLQQKLNAAVQDRDDLRVKNEQLIADMDQLKSYQQGNEEMDFGLQEQLLQKTSEYEQLIEIKNKLEEEKNNLKHELESLTNRMTEAQRNLETLENEKQQTEEQLLDLQQKLNAAVQDRDDLRVTNEQLIADMDQLKSYQPGNEEMDFGLQEQLLQKTSEYEQLIEIKNKLEEEKNNLKHELESLTNRMTEAQTNLDTLENEKHQTEEQLLDLQQKLNAAVQDRDNLRVTNEQLIADMDQLKSYQPGNEEMDFGLQEQLLQKTSEYEQLIEIKNKLEEEKNNLKLELESLTNRMTEAQTNLETLENGKHQTEEQLFDLQQKLNAAVQDKDDLEMAKERLTTEVDQLKRNLEENDALVLHLQQEIEQRTACQHEELEETHHTIKNKLEQTIEDLKKAEMQLEGLRSEKLDTEQKLLNLQHEMELVTQECNDLKASHENLTAERNQLKEALEKNAEMLKATENQQPQLEMAAQTDNLINSELEQLSNNFKDMESQLAHVQREKANTEEKLSSVQEHMEAITKERDDLQATLTSLQSERDQLKEDLRENIEMSIETQVDLRTAQEELQHQKERISELEKEISCLEQKSSSLEKELHETAAVLKEVTCERDNLDQSKQTLTTEVEELMQQLKDKESSLDQAEKEKSEASQKILELTLALNSVAEEKDLLNCSKEDVEKQSVEMQNDLRNTREELQQQKEKVETLTSDIALLEEKLSSLQRELEENITLLNEAVKEKEMLDQARQSLSLDNEQLMESLKSKVSLLELTESEKIIASQKVFELTEEVRKMSQDKEQLELLKANMEEEATKLREEFKKLQHQRAEQETQKSRRIEELLSEIEQLREKTSLKDTTAQQLEMDNADLQKKVQQYELEVASLHQEQEQFQQLLQRARSEKENIYTTLQDQEKANEQLKESLTAYQMDLESVKKQRDESKDHLTEKVNEVNAVLQQISSLQQQLQQLHQELKDERIKNNDLSEKVKDLEKEIRVLRLMQNEPEQEEDEIAERTEILQQKNEELKALMVNIFDVYDHHHRSLGNFTVELQAEVESQKQSMNAIKESLSSTHSREFGSLQTEYIKLNSQLQALLNKFKVIYRNAAVKEEQYSFINDYESDLCAVQKKNDEMLLQCQSLEENGTKWSESAAEELKFCELEFLNNLVFKKTEVMKRVEDGFSEVQVTLNSVEGDLLEEVKYKKQFLSWLEEFKGLNFDAKKFSEGIIQENKRISGVVQLLAKRLKVIVQSRIKQDTVAYLNKLDEDLQEKKQKNKELLQKMQQVFPSGDSNILEVENAQLSEKVKHLQAELKKMQCRTQQLENEVTSAKAHAKQKEERASLLQEKLLSSSTETELSEMRTKVSEKEKRLETALKEIKSLQEKVAQGAGPYQDEIDNLKSQLVKFEMDRIKLSKSTDQQIASLKSSLDYKEECLRKLKEQLRRSQKDTDATICSEKDGSPSIPVTCGGGSGIVQSTAMLMLQSENAALKREITQYKKKCHQLSRNVSSREDELKKLKDRSVETPSNLFSSITDLTSHSSSEVCRQAAVSPCRSDNPPRHIRSPGKTGMHRKHAVSPSKTHMSKPQVLSPSKTHLPKPQVMSPNKTSRHSVPVSSPGKTGLTRKRALSPLKTEGQLFSNLTESPCKKQSSPESADPPKDKFFERGKSLPYCPSKFFDNSTLGTLPDRGPSSSDINSSDTKHSADSSPCIDAEPDIYSGSTTETNEVNWWDRVDKNKNPNECKTS